MNKKIKDTIRKLPGYKTVREWIKKEGRFSTWEMPELRPIHPVRDPSPKVRLNLLIFDMDNSSLYAGAQTAMDFFLCLADTLSVTPERRIISMSPVKSNRIPRSDLFSLDSGTSDKNNIVVDLSDHSREISIRENDIFLVALWSAEYIINELSEWFETEFKKAIRIVYLIQEYEPGFSPFSSHWLLAESTYKNIGKEQVIAVFNSVLLQDYFHLMKYHFFSEYAFEPKLNPTLRDYLLTHKDSVKRKKQILIYGRPYCKRNAFELILMALNEWFEKDPNAKDWMILSAGRDFPEIKCPSGAVIHVAGKLSLEQYAKTMLESSIGISLMCSPHPSYPPLEMAAFGVHVITNQFVNKDLSPYSENIISIEKCTIKNIVSELMKLTSGTKNHKIEMNQYLEDSEVQWRSICENIKNELDL